MPYIPFTDEQKVMANSVDLEYFLRSRGEKLEKVGREYKLIYSDGSGRHDSITMSGSTWFDHKNQTGGGAIKFMQYSMGEIPVIVLNILHIIRKRIDEAKRRLIETSVSERGIVRSEAVCKDL